MQDQELIHMLNEQGQPVETMSPSVPPPTPDQMGLPPEAQLAAIYEASGKFKTLKAIAEEVNRSPAWLGKMRKLPDYQNLVKSIISEVAKRVMDQAGDLAELFNKEVRPAAATLSEIHRNPFSKDSDRVKAAVSLIDRAPAVPRVKEQTVGNTIISIPIQHMEAIQEALVDDEQGELVELIKGRDFDDLDADGGDEGGSEEIPITEII